ncbi:MAG: hypothetical protein RIR70_1610, partial [Pseudomonadota bacterium]
MTRNSIQPAIAKQASKVANTSASSHSGRWLGFERVGEQQTASHSAPASSEALASKHFDIGGYKVDVAQAGQEDGSRVALAAPRSLQDIDAALKRVFHGAQVLSPNDAGSPTASVAILGANKTLSVARLGEASATLYVVDGASREVHFKLLPGDQAHQNTAQQSAASSHIEQDEFHESSPVWDPETTHLDLAETLPGLKATDRVFLSVFHDGNTESCHPSRPIQADLAATLRQTLLDHDAGAIAGSLVKEASITRGRKITSMVVEIPMNAPRADHDLILAIADSQGDRSRAQKFVESLEAQFTAPTSTAQTDTDVLNNHALMAFNVMAQIKAVPLKQRRLLRQVNRQLASASEVFGTRLRGNSIQAATEQFLRKNPRVEKLRIDENYRPTESSLAKLGGLRHLRAMDIYNIEHIAPVLQACPQLEKLDVSGVMGLFRNRDAMKAIARHPALRELILPSFRSGFWRTESTEDEPFLLTDFFRAGPANLSHVETQTNGMDSYVGEDYPLDDDVLQQLAQSHPALESVKVGLRSLEATQKLASFEKLESLKLGLMDRDEPPGLEHLETLVK